MKEKTSITLSKEALTGIDPIAGSKQLRPAFIDNAAHELNAEVEDILRYQDPEA